MFGMLGSDIYIYDRPYIYIYIHMYIYIHTYIHTHIYIYGSAGNCVVKPFKLQVANRWKKRTASFWSKRAEKLRELVLFKGFKSSFAEEAKIAIFSIRVFP